MNNKKVYYVLLISAIVSLVLDILFFILGIALANTILLVLSFALSLVLAGLVIWGLVISTKIRRNLVKKTDEIVKVLGDKKDGKFSLVTDDKTEILTPLVEEVNTLLLDNPTNLKVNVLYSHTEFKALIANYLSSHSEATLALVRYVSKDMTEEMRESLMKDLGANYFGRGDYSLDVVVLGSTDHETLENNVKEFLEKHDGLRAIIAYYPVINKEDLFSSTYPYYVIGEKFLVVKGTSDEINNLSRVILENENRANPLDSIGAISYQYMMMSGLTHVSVTYEGNILKGARRAGYFYLESYPRDEIPFYKEVKLNISSTYRIGVVLANVDADKIKLSRQEKELEFLYVEAMKKLMLFYLSKEEKQENLAIKDDLLELTNSYYYRVDKEFNIISVSKSLQEKYADDLIGKPCYKALYKKNRPCANCPINKGEKFGVTVPSIGSDTFRLRSVPRGKYKDVYMLEESVPAVSSRDQLDERLLDYLNNDHRGYILAFKIDGLEIITRKFKVDKNYVAQRVMNNLADYSLLANLYQKEDDEFVYILDNTGREGAYALAERLVKAMEEKVDLRGNVTQLNIKIITMSYPLEVSTLFDLDSLSRTLYALAEKKGRLYRVDEDPIPIDKRRELIELLEASFMSDAIPLRYRDIVSKDGKVLYKEAMFDYRNSMGEPVRSDDITLIAKQEHYYSTLIERTIKTLNLNEGVYAMPLSKEGLNEDTFKSIWNQLTPKKAKASSIIFEVREKDTIKIKKFMDSKRDEGFRFAIRMVDVNEKKTDPKKYEYIRIEEKRFGKDILYTLKVRSLKEKGMKILKEKESTCEIDGDYIVG